MIAAVQGMEAATLRREDAAQYLGISVRMLDRYVADGLIQRLKIGTRTAFRPVDLDAFLVDRATTAAAARAAGLLSRQAAAEYLSVSTRMVDKLARSGELPKVLNGLRPAFRLSDLEAFVASRLVRSSAKHEAHA